MFDYTYGVLLHPILYYFIMLNFLSDVLYDYCKLNSLELQSADDILHTQNVTNDQRTWLLNYISVWDIIADQ